MPLPSEHAARQAQPERFERFARSDPSGWPKGLHAVFGIRAGGGSEIQSIRADASLWTAAAFRRWLEGHDFKAVIEEAAAKTSGLVSIEEPRKKGAGRIVKISAASMLMKFHGCDPDYIRETCKASCCQSSVHPSGTRIAVLRSEEPGLRKLGAKISGGYLEPSNKRCTFKSEDNLCSLHGKAAKPFGCIASPLVMNSNGTIVIRHRYTLLKCHGEGKPAYKAFAASLALLFGPSEARRISDHIGRGGGDVEARLLPSAEARLAEGNQIRKAAPKLLPPPSPNREPYPYSGVIELPGGFRVLVETARGETRSGVDPDGAKWAIKMPAHYGEIEGTKGADGDALDCFIGPDLPAPLVFCMAIKIPGSGRFDEDKLFIGFSSREAAERCFDDAYDRDDLRMELRELKYTELKAWILDRKNEGARVRSGRVLERFKALAGRLLDGPGAALAVDMLKAEELSSVSVVSSPSSPEPADLTVGSTIRIAFPVVQKAAAIQNQIQSPVLSSLEVDVKVSAGLLSELERPRSAQKATEGDKVGEKNRLTDIKVKEVSVVDSAANARVFAIVKSATKKKEGDVPNPDEKKAADEKKASEEEKAATSEEEKAAPSDEEKAANEEKASPSDEEKAEDEEKAAPSDEEKAAEEEKSSEEEKAAAPSDEEKATDEEKAAEEEKAQAKAAARLINTFKGDRLKAVAAITGADEEAVKAFAVEEEAMKADPMAMVGAGMAAIVQELRGIRTSLSGSTKAAEEEAKASAPGSAEEAEKGAVEELKGTVDDLVAKISKMEKKPERPASAGPSGKRGEVKKSDDSWPIDMAAK